MTNRIRKSTIDRYYDFMVELKSYLDKEEDFVKTQLVKAHSISNAVWPGLRMAKYISGNIPGVDMKFNLKEIEPIHARIVIDNVNGYCSSKKKKRKGVKKDIKPFQETEPNKPSRKTETNEKYLNFLKAYYFFKRERIDFKEADMIKRHNVSKNIISACFKTGFVDVKYDNYIFRNEPTYKDVDEIKAYLNKWQNEAMKISREKGNVKSEKPKEKQKETKPTKQKTVYYLFGLKIMESITTEIT